MNRSRTSSAVATAMIAFAISACADGTAPEPTLLPEDALRMSASASAVSDASSRLAPSVTNAEGRARLVSALRSLDRTLSDGGVADSQSWLAIARSELAQAKRANWLGDAECDAIAMALASAGESLEFRSSR
jgi:hypothetical protein